MKKAVPFIITVILIAVLGGAFCKLYYDHYMYTNERQNLDEYYGVQDGDDFPVIYENFVSEMHARRFGDTCYLDFETVKSLLNDRFYYGKKDGTLSYCYPDEQIVATVGNTGWVSSKSGAQETAYAPAVLEGDTLYIALEYIRKFTNFYYAVYTGPNRVVLRTAWGKEQMATLKSDTNMRTLGGVKAPIIAAVEQGTDVLVLETVDEWTRIETADGFYGYIENKYLTETREQELEPVTDVVEPEIEYRKMDGRVCLAWNVISFKESNEFMPGMLVGTKAINVLAPTWFTLDSEDGDIDNKASRDYIKTAHDNGMQVWGVLDNFQNHDGRLYTQFLETYAGRQKVIKTVVEEALKYGIEGINVDIEGLTEAEGPDFVEFVREIGIACRNAGLFISVNNYVPYNFNDFYDLEEQARYADYVILMGYDEHFAGSEEAGSVASIGYVEYGIQEMLKEVPADRLINAIPFYTRGWETKKEKVSSQMLDMVEAKAFMAEHDMKKEWNSTAGQYYAEKQSGDTLYQIWLEDKRSVKCKLDVMEENGIHGLAVWRLGLETNDVWDKIEDYIKK